VNLSRWWPGAVLTAGAGAGASQPPVARKGPRTPGALQGPNAMQIGSDVSSDLAGTEFAGTPSGSQRRSLRARGEITQQGDHGGEEDGFHQDQVPFGATQAIVSAP